MAGGCPGRSGRPRLLRPRLLCQVEISPFKPARANQGLARPPFQQRAAWPGSRRSRSETLAPRAVSLLPRLPAATQPVGLQALPPCPRWGPMERSLHRVSLGSRRARPDLSFYLPTFGKCLGPGCSPARVPRKASSRGDRRGGSRRASSLPAPALAASSCDGPGGSRAPAQAEQQDPTCCQLQLVLPHLAGIIFQRPGLAPRSFLLASSSG